jgi:hypothetical protein
LREEYEGLPGLRNLVELRGDGKPSLMVWRAFPKPIQVSDKNQNPGFTCLPDNTIVDA